MEDEAQDLGGRDLVQSCSFNEWRNRGREEGSELPKFKELVSGPGSPSLSLGRSATLCCFVLSQL